VIAQRKRRLEYRASDRASAAAVAVAVVAVVVVVVMTAGILSSRRGVRRECARRWRVSTLQLTRRTGSDSRDQISGKWGALSSYA